MTNAVYDGNSVFARSYFAAEKEHAGDPEYAISLAVKTILRILHPERNRLGVQFTHSFFAWDGEQAKSKQRKPKPPEYHATRLVLKEVLSLMLGTVHFEHPDYEGDDIVATAAYQSDPADTVYIISGDKDLQQLQGGNCRYYCLNNKAELSSSFISTRFNVKRPNQVAIALAIQGDPVDGIPGIRGWGPVRVKHLFEKVPKNAKFEEALAIIEHEIPPQFQPAFQDSLARTLLGANVPDVPKPAEIVMGEPDNIAQLDIPDIAVLYQEVYEAYSREA